VLRNFQTVSLETVWKIARWLLDCGHGWSTVSKIALFGILLSPCRAPVGGLFEFPDSLSRETVWKIAGGFLIACVSCCKRARWDVFVLFWLLAILQIEAYWDFPDSL
jgi:hypothetical protein